MKSGYFAGAVTPGTVIWGVLESTEPERTTGRNPGRSVAVASADAAAGRFLLISAITASVMSKAGSA